MEMRTEAPHFNLMSPTIRMAERLSHHVQKKPHRTLLQPLYLVAYLAHCAANIFYVCDASAHILVFSELLMLALGNDSINGFCLSVDSCGLSSS